MWRSRTSAASLTVALAGPPSCTAALVRNRTFELSDAEIQASVCLFSCHLSHSAVYPRAGIVDGRSAEALVSLILDRHSSCRCAREGARPRPRPRSCSPHSPPRWLSPHSRRPRPRPGARADRRHSPRCRAPLPPHAHANTLTRTLRAHTTTQTPPRTWDPPSRALRDTPLSSCLSVVQ